MLAKYIGGPRNGETATLRGGVQVGWMMRANERGKDCLYRLERLGGKYVLRAVTSERVR